MQCMSNIFGSIASTVVGHKKSGKNLQILRPIFRSFWSQWLACFGWMASQTQMCLTGICQGTILDTRQKFRATAHFCKSQILDTDPSKLKLLTATLNWCVPDPFYWEHMNILLLVVYIAFKITSYITHHVPRGLNFVLGYNSLSLFFGDHDCRCLCVLKDKDW